MRHIISVILEDEAGALSRVSGLFTQRGFNIESLTVAQTNDPTLSRMTIVSSGSDAGEGPFVDGACQVFPLKTQS